MPIHLQRKLLHIGLFVFALFIGRIPPWAISLSAFAAFLFNLFLLSTLTRNKLSRHKDKGSDLGLLLYPASLTLLSLLFYEQQIYMAIAWGAMAFGDAAAALMGGRWKIPWNKDKSFSGTLAFVLLGGGLSLVLVFLLPRSLYLNMSFHEWMPIILLAVLVSAFVESIPGLIDDNFSVPVSAALCAFFFRECWFHGAYFFPENVWLGLFLTLLFMILSWGSGKIDLAGTFAGGVIAFFIYLGGGFPAMGLLLVFFVLGTAVSMWRRSDKQAQGLAQENEGKRSINNALANAGVAAVCGCCAWAFSSQQEMFLLMLMASLAAATGDTFASELGNLYGKRYINILSLKSDKRGNDGAISLEGSLAGMLGAFLLVLAYALATATFSPGMFVAAGAGFLGVMIDSALGASLQQKKLLNNDTVNFAMTLFSALIMWGLYSFF